MNADAVAALLHDVLGAECSGTHSLGYATCQRQAAALAATLDQHSTVRPSELMQADMDIVHGYASNPIRATAQSVPGGVHNHGTETGKGISCPEYLIGECRIEQISKERDAWKVLHDATGPFARYGYASQKQLREIQEAQKIVGI